MVDWILKLGDAVEFEWSFRVWVSRMQEARFLN